MRTINAFILLCVFCLFCQPTLAQRRVRLADLPPFERAVVVVKYFEHFKGYGKDALLLSLLAYNVGVGRLLGYGKHPKCRLLRKIESGDRNFYWEYVSFCRYKGNVLRGLFKRRQLEFNLFFIR